MQPMPRMPMQQQDQMGGSGMVQGAGMGGMAQSGMMHSSVNENGDMVRARASIAQRTDAGELFEPHDATRAPAPLE